MFDVIRNTGCISIKDKHFHNNESIFSTLINILSWTYRVIKTMIKSGQILIVTLLVIFLNNILVDPRDKI